MRSFEYHKPGTIEEAVGLIGSLEDARFIAGGTDVMVLFRHKKIAPKNLISLRNIKVLTGIEHKDGLWIGSGVTHTDIVKDEFIRQFYSALHDATSNIGSRQIRNVATIGGNICNAAPSADTACPLLVLDAKVIAAGQKGEREIDIDEFFLGPNRTALEKGELVRAFKLPAFANGTGSAYIKHTRRQAMDLPILGIGARITVKKEGGNLRCEDVRIAMVVMAPRPIRAKKAEEALKGQMISEKVLEEAGVVAANESMPRDSIRGEAWYRREMAKVLVKRVIMKAVERITD